MDFHEACLIGDISRVKECIQRQGSEFDFNEGLRGACKGGHLPIVHLMIENGANKWNWGLRGACEGGHLPVIQLMIENGAHAWDAGLGGACLGGHLAIVLFMIEQGANYWNYGLSNACSGGHMELVRLMIEKGANGWTWAFYKACTAGHLEIAALLFDLGATSFMDFNSLLSPDQQLQVYNLVTKDKVRLQLEQRSPTIKERLRLTTIIVLDDRIPDHLIRTIVIEYL